MWRYAAFAAGVALALLNPIVVTALRSWARGRVSSLMDQYRAEQDAERDESATMPGGKA